jgi:hypothetical protein
MVAVWKYRPRQPGSRSMTLSELVSTIGEAVLLWSIVLA